MQSVTAGCQLQHASSSADATNAYRVNEALQNLDEGQADCVNGEKDVVRFHGDDAAWMPDKILVLHFWYPEESDVENGVAEETGNVQREEIEAQSGYTANQLK